ncbi:hypothetical protein QBC41DRAFT_346159 [Cercophora samala]|uniref:Uncharacterized protein n=1 Tax=Cercophora samala TaxID=330535 RepID=A0AA39ZEQ9_9PEZI|nr:hypothetical protein QBC41DRAFT_346159 [Cercophora samala]
MLPDRYSPVYCPPTLDPSNDRDVQYAQYHFEGVNDAIFTKVIDFSSPQEGYMMWNWANFWKKTTEELIKTIDQMRQNQVSNQPAPVDATAESLKRAMEECLEPLKKQNEALLKSNLDLIKDVESLSQWVETLQKKNTDSLNEMDSSSLAMTGATDDATPATTPVITPPETVTDGSPASEPVLPPEPYEPQN